MRGIIVKVKTVDCKRLEQLEDSLDLIISNISEWKLFHGKESYILKFK